MRGATWQGEWDGASKYRVSGLELYLLVLMNLCSIAHCLMC